MREVCPECGKPDGEHKMQCSRRDGRGMRLPARAEDYRHALIAHANEGVPTGQILQSAAQTLADLGPSSPVPPDSGSLRGSFLVEAERRDREAVLAEQRRRKA